MPNNTKQPAALITTTAEQDAAVAEKFSGGDHPFAAGHYHDDYLPDMLRWMADRDMVPLEDGSAGGIVGYVHREHADRIAGLLNAAALNAKMPVAC